MLITKFTIYDNPFKYLRIRQWPNNDENSKNIILTKLKIITNWNKNNGWQTEFVETLPSG